MIAYEGIYIFGGMLQNYKDNMPFINDKLYLLRLEEQPLDKKDKKQVMKFVFKSADDLEEKVHGERPPGLYDHGMI